MSLDEVKMKTSASQFVRWMEYLDWEINAFDKTCYYLAQIAAEVRRPNMPKGKTVTLKDFIIKFTSGKAEEKPLEDVQTRANKMKQFFFGLTGLSRKKKKRIKRL